MKTVVPRRYVLLSLAVLVLLGVDVGAQDVTNYWQAVSNAFIGNILVHGTVQDTNSCPVADVNLRVQVVGLDKLRGDERELVAYEKLLTNGTFVVDQTNCHRVLLVFLCDGYRLAAREYTIGDEDHYTNSTPQMLLITNELVTLASKGELANLVTYEGQISFSTSGVFRVLDLAKGTDQAFFTVTNRDDLPCTVLYLIAETNDNGAITVDPYGIPQGVQLTGTGDYNRFVTFGAGIPATNDALMVTEFGQMREAPTTGYTNCIPIEPESGREYFFLHVTNWYGKGSIKSVRRVSDGTIRSRILVRIRKDGAVNVATDE